MVVSRAGKWGLCWKEDEVNRYLVFAGFYYYPSGGFDDFYASSDQKESAIELAKQAMVRNDWVQVIDMHLEQEIYGLPNP